MAFAGFQAQMIFVLSLQTTRQARGREFAKRERRSLLAHCVYIIAYGARCTHSLEPSKTDWEENSWPYLLRSEGEALLREAAA